jgi:hypothetical protein
MEYRAAWGDSSSWAIPLPSSDLAANSYSAPRPGEPDGMCPLCNNARRAKYDAMIVGGVPFNQLSMRLAWREELIRHHAQAHVWPVYAVVFDAAFAPYFLPEGDIDALRLSIPRTVPSAAVLYSLVRETRERYRGLKVQYEEEASSLPSGDMKGFVLDGMEVADPGKPRSLAPWDNANQAMQTSLRHKEALNFYDEMLDIREDAKRVYDEIMDSGELKYYSTAVSAVRERRGVVETLCKMSLIARQLSDGDGKARKLSPALQGIVDTLGPLEDGD